MTKVGCPRVRTGRQGQLSAIFAIIGQTKLIFKLEPESDGSNTYMKIGRNKNKND